MRLPTPRLCRNFAFLASREGIFVGGNTGIDLCVRLKARNDSSKGGFLFDVLEGLKRLASG